jgi:hypothetical protein
MELLDMLYMIRDCRRPRLESRILDEYGLTYEGLFDVMEEAHNMGAVIKRNVTYNSTYWACVNWPEIEEAGILHSWIEREEAKLP